LRPGDDDLAISAREQLIVAADHPGIAVGRYATLRKFIGSPRASPGAPASIDKFMLPAIAATPDAHRRALGAGDIHFRDPAIAQFFAMTLSA